MKLHAQQVEAENWQGTVRQNIFVGTDLQTIVDLPGGLDLIVRTQNSDKGRAMIFDPGHPVFVDVEFGSARMLAD